MKIPMVPKRLKKPKNVYNFVISHNFNVWV